MNDVADDAKVEKLAIRLSVPEAVLTQLKKEFGVDTPLLATKVVDTYIEIVHSIYI